MVLTKKDIKNILNKEQNQYQKVESQAKKLDQVKAAQKDTDDQDAKLDKDDLFIHTIKQMKKDVKDPQISNDSECLDEDKVNLDQAMK